MIKRKIDSITGNKVQLHVRPVHGGVGVFRSNKGQPFDSTQWGHRSGSFGKVSHQVFGIEHVLLTKGDGRIDGEMDAMGVDVVLQIVTHTQIADDRNLCVWLKKEKKRFLPSCFTARFECLGE